MLRRELVLAACDLLVPDGAASDRRLAHYEVVAGAAAPEALELAIGRDGFEVQVHLAVAATGARAARRQPDAVGVGHDSGDRLGARLRLHLGQGGSQMVLATRLSSAAISTFERPR